LQEFEIQVEVGRYVARTARDTIRLMDTQIEQSSDPVVAQRLPPVQDSGQLLCPGVEKYNENVFEESLELLTML
jgi:hypothetical protein